MNSTREALPKLVLLPGLHGSAALFDDLADRLRCSVELHRIEYPERHSASLEDLIRHVAEQTPKAQPYYLLAESFSGPIAWQHCMGSSEDIRGLMLCASFLDPPLPRGLSRILGLLSGFIARLPRSRLGLRYLLLEKDSPPELVDAVLREVDGLPPSVLAERLRWVAQVSEGSADPSVDLPVLYLEGGRDRLIGSRGWRSVRARQPAAKRVVLDAPHLLLQTRPAQAAALVLEFVAECEEGRRS